MDTGVLPEGSPPRRAAGGHEEQAPSEGGLRGHSPRSPWGLCSPTGLVPWVLWSRCGSHPALSFAFRVSLANPVREVLPAPLALS